MSILIKDMEMPVCCAECPLNHDAECKYYPYNRLICDEPYTQRGDWCPLIEVPPHGRLIDADALLVSENQHYEYHSDSYYVETRTIELAPTIIKAED